MLKQYLWFTSSSAFHFLIRVRLRIILSEIIIEKNSVIMLHLAVFFISRIFIFFDNTQMKCASFEILDANTNEFEFDFNTYESLLNSNKYDKNTNEFNLLTNEFNSNWNTLSFNVNELDFHFDVLDSNFDLVEFGFDLKSLDDVTFSFDEFDFLVSSSNDFNLAFLNDLTSVTRIFEKFLSESWIIEQNSNIFADNFNLIMFDEKHKNSLFASKIKCDVVVENELSFDKARRQNRCLYLFKEQADNSIRTNPKISIRSKTSLSLKTVRLLFSKRLQDCSVKYFANVNYSVCNEDSLTQSDESKQEYFYHEPDQQWFHLFTVFSREFEWFCLDRDLRNNQDLHSYSILSRLFTEMWVWYDTLMLRKRDFSRTLYFVHVK